MAADNEPTTLVGGQIALANEARRGAAKQARRVGALTYSLLLVSPHIGSRRQGIRRCGAVESG